MGDDPFESLSRREREILAVLYRHRELTVGQLSDELDDPPTASALRSHLLLLEAKGKVERDRSGRRNRYRPLDDPLELRTSALRHVVRTFFGGSVGRLVHSLLSDEQLVDVDAAEIQRLRELLEPLDLVDDSAEGHDRGDQGGDP